MNATQRLGDRRLPGLGYPAGRGRETATALLDAAAGHGTMDVRTLLDRVTAP